MALNPSPFAGFPYFDSNFIWCPNQYLDQCVVAHDRGVVRLVGYILFQTLRLLDENGVPVEQDISVSFKKIIEEAGVSRGGAASKIQAALQHHFITCVQTPLPKRAGEPGRVGKYCLVWHKAFTIAILMSLLLPNHGRVAEEADGDSPEYNVANVASEIYDAAADAFRVD